MTQKLTSAQFKAIHGKKAAPSPDPDSEPLMSNQLSEPEIQKVFDCVTIPAVWKGLSELGYTFIKSNPTSLKVSNGRQTFELIIKQK